MIHKITLHNKTIIHICITARIHLVSDNKNLVLTVRLLVVHLMCWPSIVPTRMKSNNRMPVDCKIQNKPSTANDSD